MCTLLYFSLVRLSVCAFAIHSMYANLSFKTTIIKQNTKIPLIAGVPSSQALPGYFIPAPPSVCVPDVIGALACGFQTIPSALGSFVQSVLGVYAYVREFAWHTRTCIHTYTHIYTRTHIHTHAQTQTQTHILSFTHTHTYTHTLSHTHTHTRTHKCGAAKHTKKYYAISR